MSTLFSEFPEMSANQWKEQIVKDLKNTDYSQLIWKTRNGIDIQPFYTKEDISSRETEPMFSHADWGIGETIVVNDEKIANQEALRALEGGASCLNFQLDGVKNLNQLLEAILIEHIGIQFTVNTQPEVFSVQLSTFISERNLNIHDLCIAINYDVLAHAIEHGCWMTNLESDLNSVRQLTTLPFNIYKLVVDASLYHNTGANQVTELALILSHYNEYLNYLSSVNFDFSVLEKGIQLNVSVGSDFFGELAKLRALRQLINLINKEYKLDAPIYISCTTSLLTLSSKDAYTNLLRTTTQSMSSVLGGCNMLYVTPFNQSFSTDNVFSKRMARNQQLILKEESYLHKIADAGAGSYYIESLTDQLATKAFELFKTWESQGGFLACLQSGSIQQLVTTQANELKEKVRNGELVLIGVNKYSNPNEQVERTTLNKPIKKSAVLFEPLSVLYLSEITEDKTVSTNIK